MSRTPEQDATGNRSSGKSATDSGITRFLGACKIWDLDVDDFEVIAAGMSNERDDVQDDVQDDSRDNEASHGSVCKLDPEDGRWICIPYKRQKLQDEIDEAQATGSSKKDATLETLQKNNVTCFIVTHESSNILKDIQSIIDKATSQNFSVALRDTDVKLRCCLFEDKNGRIFNLVVSEHSVGPATEWASLMQTFSGIQAMIAFAVLCRSFPCAFSDNIGQLQPALISVILGLVFKEEISLSALNVSMTVRCMPSVSAHTLTAELGSDWLRKGATLLLAFAAATTGETQRYMTIIGIFLMGAILLANLGSRAWHFTKCKPIRFCGPFSPISGYGIAILAGFCLPYMGYREIAAGGKPALECVLGSALVVAVAFVLSDIDAIQRFIVLGSESCPQEEVNVGFGVWWTLTFLSSLFMVLSIKPYHQMPADEEYLLVAAQESPVGFKVPNLPDYIVDPILAREGIRFFSKSFEFVFGVVAALLVGMGIVYLNFTNVDDTLTGQAL